MGKSEIGPAVAFAASAAKDLGWSEDDIYGLEMCVEELLANLVFYGGAARPEVEITLASGGKVTLSDNGNPFNPATAVPSKVSDPLQTQAIGGLGLGLVHQFCRAITYARQGSKNVVQLHFGDGRV